MGVYPYLKALHVVAVVSWFAGLLYIVRLFIYHVEAGGRPEPGKSLLEAQFSLMEKRLWLGITTPAMLATTLFGTWMAVQTRAWEAPWFQLKLGLLALLFAYHFICGKIRSDLSRGRVRVTSVGLRIWNEVATLLLFAIVFTAILKSPAGAGRGMLGVAAFAVVLLLAMRLAKRLRKD